MPARGREHYMQGERKFGDALVILVLLRGVELNDEVMVVAARELAESALAQNARQA